MPSIFGVFGLSSGLNFLDCSSFKFDGPSLGCRLQRRRLFDAKLFLICRMNCHLVSSLRIITEYPLPTKKCGPCLWLVISTTHSESCKHATCQAWIRSWKIVRAWLPCTMIFEILIGRLRSNLSRPPKMHLRNTKLRLSSRRIATDNSTTMIPKSAVESEPRLCLWLCKCPFSISWPRSKKPSPMDLSKCGARSRIHPRKSLSRNGLAKITRRGAMYTKQKFAIRRANSAKSTRTSPSRPFSILCVSHFQICRTISMSDAMNEISSWSHGIAVMNDQPSTATYLRVLDKQHHLCFIISTNPILWAPVCCTFAKENQVVCESRAKQCQIRTCRLEN